MNNQDKKPMSSRQVLEAMGLSGLPDDALGGFDVDGGLVGDLPASLRERFHHLKEVRHTLRPGMVVTWKPGLKNRSIPSYGKPGIVLELLESPVLDSTDFSSTYFREPLDMVIGLFGESGKERGKFYVFHTSSERYQPWVESGHDSCSA